MHVARVVLCVVTGCCAGLIPALASAQEAATPKTSSEIRDEGRMFGDDARKKALGDLERIEKDRHVPVLIETLESLQGQDLLGAATRRARQWGKRGLYVLLAKREHRLEVLRNPALETVVSNPARHTIIEAFTTGLRGGNADTALAGGVKAISDVLAKAASEGHTAASESASSSLVARNQLRLNLAGAKTALAAAEAKAASMGWKMNIAVVDDGGHLLAFSRMDGARPASVATAITKATTAATLRQASGPLPPGSSVPDVLLNLSLQNAAAASGGKITTLLGGVPIIVDGQVIGALGVGGGTGEQDADVAKAGVTAFVEALTASASE
jgi:glc operon protein GlcG